MAGKIKNKAFITKPLLLSAGLMAVLILASFYAVWFAKREIFRDIQNTYNQSATDIKSQLKDSLNVKIAQLYGMRSYVLANKQLNNESWNAYISGLNLKQLCPCIVSAIYAKRTPAKDRDHYINAYVWPIEAETALGFDISSEPIRLETLELARDTGKATISKPITDPASGVKTFVIAFPVYQAPANPETVEKRRELLTGYIYLVSDADLLFSKALASAADSLGKMDLEIYSQPSDGLSAGDLMFDSKPEKISALDPSLPPNRVYSRNLNFFNPAWNLLFHEEIFQSANRTWLFYYYAPLADWSHGFLQNHIGAFTMILSAISSFLVSWVFWLILTSRARALAQAEVLTSELRASEQQYRFMVENSPFAIAVHSEGMVVAANKAAVNLLGAKLPQELIGKPITEIVHPDYHKIVAKRIKKEVEEKAPAEPLEEKFIKLNGEVIDVLVAASPIIYNNKPAAQVVIQDITQRKKAEKEIKEHSEQLERLNKIFVGRELRMAELKRELQELKEKLTERNNQDGGKK
ncbi:CHASE domain-containing protein [Candidatus Wolfebacteria bacterium]|nr:CHASE domain-containing protein [Candidatus Wolfebacteria bacterium]